MTRRTSTRDPRVLKLQLWRPANHVFSKPACCGCRRFGGMRILLFRYHWSDPVCIIVNQKAQVGKQISPGLSTVVVSFKCLCHCSSDQLGGWVMDPESQFQQRFISSNNSNINAPEVAPDTQVDQKCVPRAPLLPREPPAGRWLRTRRRCTNPVLHLSVHQFALKHQPLAPSSTLFCRPGKLLKGKVYNLLALKSKRLRRQGRC